MDNRKVRVDQSTLSVIAAGNRVEADASIGELYDAANTNTKVTLWAMKILLCVGALATTFAVGTLSRSLGGWMLGAVVSATVVYVEASLLTRFALRGGWRLFANTGMVRWTCMCGIVIAQLFMGLGTYCAAYVLSKELISLEDRQTEANDSQTVQTVVDNNAATLLPILKEKLRTNQELLVKESASGFGPRARALQAEISKDMEKIERLAGEQTSALMVAQETKNQFRVASRDSSSYTQAGLGLGLTSATMRSLVALAAALLVDVVLPWLLTAMVVAFRGDVIDVKTAVRMTADHMTAKRRKRHFPW